MTTNAPKRAMARPKISGEVSGMLYNGKSKVVLKPVLFCSSGVREVAAAVHGFIWMLCLDPDHSAPTTSYSLKGWEPGRGMKMLNPADGIQ